MSRDFEVIGLEIWSREASADGPEGVGAFLEKREAAFADRVSDASDDFVEGFDTPRYR